MSADGVSEERAATEIGSEEAVALESRVPDVQVIEGPKVAQANGAPPEKEAAASSLPSETGRADEVEADSKRQPGRTEREGGQEISETKPLLEPKAAATAAAPESSGWGWGSWTSVVSAIQEAAVEAQRTAAAAAKEVVEQLEAEVRAVDQDMEARQGEGEGEADRKEEKAKEEAAEEREEAKPAAESGEAGVVEAKPEADGKSDANVVGQGLQSLDDSMEIIASNALQALGSAWKGGLNLLQSLEQAPPGSKATTKDATSPSPAGQLAPSLLESGRGLAEQGLRVLEIVGREAVEVLALETGMKLEADEPMMEKPESKEEDIVLTEEEEVSFDHCFYIYGGPDYLEELEALSRHHTLVYSRARAKMSEEERGALEEKLQEVRGTLEGELTKAEKKKQEELQDSEVQSLRETSVQSAAQMASSFSARLTGLPVHEMEKRCAEQLEAIKVEGVHRISEVCAVSISRIVEGARSILSTGTSGEVAADQDGNVASTGEASPALSWTERCIAQAEVLKGQAASMAADIGAVEESFCTGMDDILAVLAAAVTRREDEEAKEDPKVAALEVELSSLQKRKAALETELKSATLSAVGRLEQALQYLPPVLLSSTLKSSPPTGDNATQA